MCRNPSQLTMKASSSQIAIQPFAVAACWYKCEFYSPKYEAATSVHDDVALYAYIYAMGTGEHVSIIMICRCGNFISAPLLVDKSAEQ